MENLDDTVGISKRTLVFRDSGHFSIQTWGIWLNSNYVVGYWHGADLPS